jgi:DNA modification methylase
VNTPNHAGGGQAGHHPAEGCEEKVGNWAVESAENRDTAVAMNVQLIPLSHLIEATWIPNQMRAALIARLRRSITTFGVVEPLVARPLAEAPDRFEVISGNQRLALYRELDLESAPVVVVALDDAEARLLAQVLNRTRGADDERAYAALLEEVLERFTPADVAGLLPETESSLARLLAEHGSGREVEEALEWEPPAEPRSKPGELYELGPHRLLCGDATDPEAVARLFAGETAALMVTDPPYGVGVDHTWRDGVRQPAGSARSATLLNDDRAEWTEAYALAPASVAYVWHGALFAGLVQAGLEAAGFVVRQQIVWVKQIHALSRAHYQWRHEPCWYAVRKGASANWQGDRKDTTVWECASPIAGWGSGGRAEDMVTAHPTQKPLEIYERPILNHTCPGDIVYDPFAGSGTCVIAAARHGRRCFAIELDPAWCDLVRDRYQAWADDRGAAV